MTRQDAGRAGGGTLSRTRWDDPSLFSSGRFYHHLLQDCVVDQAFFLNLALSGLLASLPSAGPQGRGGGEWLGPTLGQWPSAPLQARQPGAPLPHQRCEPGTNQSRLVRLSVKTAISIELSFFLPLRLAGPRGVWSFDLFCTCHEFHERQGDTLPEGGSIRCEEVGLRGLSAKRLCGLLGDTVNIFVVSDGIRRSKCCTTDA